MRWIKKIVRAILALMPAFIISMCMTHTSYAMSHELNGIRWATPSTFFWGPNGANTQPTDDFAYPDNTLGFGSSSQRFSVSWWDSATGTSTAGPFSQLYDRDVFYYNFPANSSNWLDFYKLQYRMYPKWVNGTCTMDYSKPTSDGKFDLKYIGFPNQSRYSISYGFNYSPYSLSDTNGIVKCTRLDQEYSAELPFNQDSLSSIGDIRGNASPRMVYQYNLSPHFYTSDGFYTKTHRINTSTGEAYTSSFYLTELTGGVLLNKFTGLSIPIYNSDTDDDCTNSMSDRDISFKGVFRFDENDFHFNPNLNSQSKFGIQATLLGPDYYRQPTIPGGGWADCISNYVTVDGYQQLEFTCGTIHVPSFGSGTYLLVNLVISGREDYNDTSKSTWVWDSSGNWSFGGLYIITDNNDTPGCTLGDDLHGSHIIGDHTVEDMAEAQNGSYGGLTNLFGFTFINPFASLFNLFTNADSCASIPTIANMIHSEETQVCPWFDSTTRTIVTPVLGISSMMLVFGFAVRWLKSSSGNDTIDAGKHPGGE